MRSGCTIDGVRYKGMFVRVEGGGGKGREGRNAWLTIECTEGKVSPSVMSMRCQLWFGDASTQSRLSLLQLELRFGDTILGICVGTGFGALKGLRWNRTSRNTVSIAVFIAGNPILGAHSQRMYRPLRSQGVF